ncbi:flagellar filament capping protein FliD [Vreelandella rituensis]|uniref:Flagellar hook-associated protein 2 n=1 Tax=Vreelandella rituensis TaxID=2282306 RepID=A0A368TZG7_9GAMM|nr:flagellar filament capping protein FliD [Halomonas rituensis]RCV89607.1 flagellar hook protein [Halomonas rituensis]
MATITSLGIGSGLDLNGLIDQLKDAERGKLEPIKRQQEQQQAKISAYGQLQTSLNSFQDAVGKLNDASLFQSLSTNVRGEGIAANATADALPGRYSVNVETLAKAGSLATTRVDSLDDVLTGENATLKLSFGAGTETSEAVINLEAGSTLADIRDQINADKQAGVTASIINDGTGYRLALNSKTTGADTSIQEIGFTGLAAGMTLASEGDTKRVGKDALLDVNGVTVTSPTNEVKGAIQGVTLTLEEEGSSSSVVVERDTLAVRDNVNGFVKAFNVLKTTIDKLTSFNGDSSTAGELLGDNTVRTIESRLRSVLGGGVAGGELSTLSQLGISLKRDGTLEIDDKKLSGLVAGDQTAISDFFAGSDKQGGLAGKLDTTLSQLQGNNGLMKSSISGAENRIESLNTRYERMEATIERTIGRYRTQFSQLDGMISQMNQVSSYLTQQFDALDYQLGRKK